MTGNQKLVIFNLAIIFPIFVLTIIFPIFVLAEPRDGSSSELDDPNYNFAIFYDRNDKDSWPDCKCISPAKFSPEGFGNCNVGSSRTDRRPWCYMSHFDNTVPEDGFGPAHDVCPDQKESETYPGFYWSRFPCIV